MLYLTKIWPITNASKELLFLQEIEEIFELPMPSGVNVPRAVEPLFNRLSSHCVVSNHFQVAERSLFLLNNDHLVKLITQNKELFPVVLKGLQLAQKNHWN